MVFLHIYVVEFYVQVHHHDDPRLIGSPFVLQKHGDIIAVSPEARALGMHHHMLVGDVQPPTSVDSHTRIVNAWTSKSDSNVLSERYNSASTAIFTLVRSFITSTPAEKNSGFEQVCIDEAYLEPDPIVDLRGLSRLIELQEQDSQHQEDDARPAPRRASSLARLFNHSKSTSEIQSPHALAKESEELDAGCVLGDLIQREVFAALRYDCLVGVGLTRQQARRASLHEADDAASCVEKEEGGQLEISSTGAVPVHEAQEGDMTEDRESRSKQGPCSSGDPDMAPLPVNLPELRKVFRLWTSAETACVEEEEGGQVEVSSTGAVPVYEAQEDDIAEDKESRPPSEPVRSWDSVGPPSPSNIIDVSMPGSASDNHVTGSHNTAIFGTDSKIPPTDDFSASSPTGAGLYTGSLEPRSDLYQSRSQLSSEVRQPLFPERRKQTGGGGGVERPKGELLQRSDGRNDAMTSRRRQRAAAMEVNDVWRLGDVLSIVGTSRAAADNFTLEWGVKEEVSELLALSDSEEESI
uniref:UmuC domain-containing protein n=1 Tax=Octactis speculum TaxID=3111310 RepID=A0A7S2DF82_9STRA|mmetsp:Transcript_4740/g.5691  ORF Transcript_4740/g.5691 Transcript_4740/m.5691 type:complete len:523 (+) Transcript_4740:134-1702(+)|eukprot:CAMPEP_0185772076 /NCGR_PEP_ID=MMETSP1174-20130828/66790_1 /TAXON_ID=35687 /ORGANISM="Dictyocha speculum, Strain CCMP1381" /LENGTH=522 /DNA_ID=CAMNT_0028458165 /DNA_START=115 /DNA_END=1683 /DNA_ORIENTATION=-